MKILLINHYAGTPDLGMEYRPYYMAREWVRLGHDVTIVAASQSHVRAKQPAGVGFSKVEYIDGIRYIWLRTPRYAGSGLGRILNMGAFLLHLALRTVPALRERNYSAVIASSTYPLDSIPAHWIARRCGAKFVFELHDLWPLSPMELGGYSPNHPFIRIMQWGEDYYCRHADAVVSMLPCALTHLQARGLDPTKWHYVPNGVVIEDWNTPVEVPISVREPLERAHVQGKFVVGYAGTIGIANALDSFIDAAKLLDDRHQFVIVGQGPEALRLRARIENEGIGNVLLLSAIPKLAIPNLLRLFDVGYIGLQRQSLFRFGISPNKIFDYMMAGLPFVQAIEAGNSPATDANCGIAVEPEDPKKIAEAILHLKSLDRATLASLGKNGQSYVQRTHDITKLADIFLTALC